jgi:hypothetical protein
LVQQLAVGLAEKMVSVWVCELDAQ